MIFFLDPIDLLCASSEMNPAIPGGSLVSSWGLTARTLSKCRCVRQSTREGVGVAQEFQCPPARYGFDVSLPVSEVARPFPEVVQPHPRAAAAGRTYDPSTLPRPFEIPENLRT